MLRAAGAEYEAELPFSGLHELLHPVLGLVEELPAPQASALRGALAMSDEAVERFAVFAAVFGLLVAAAAERPVLVCVDDAQWIDSASLEALGFAARRVGGDRVAILVAFRDEVAASFRVPRFELLALGGLVRTRSPRSSTARPSGRSAATSSSAWRAPRTATRWPRWRSPPRSATTGWRAGSALGEPLPPGA